MNYLHKIAEALANRFHSLLEKDTLEIAAESISIGVGASAIGFAINDSIHLIFVTIGGVITAFLAGLVNSWWKEKERKKEIDHLLKIRKLNSESGNGERRKVD